jgi:hypothetical protein
MAVSFTVTEATFSAKVLDGTQLIIEFDPGNLKF